jgi:hypothetical protein
MSRSRDLVTSVRVYHCLRVYWSNPLRYLTGLGAGVYDPAIFVGYLQERMTRAAEMAGSQVPIPRVTRAG